MKYLIFGWILWLTISTLHAQDPQWDDTARQGWPTAFTAVQIPYSADGTIQMAYFRASERATPQPLIVSLHTWSGDYQQKDPLIKEVLEKDYNYIRPNFRGPNNRPEAMGSALVASDIDDAIAYALEHGNVDRDNIHVIGVSGGGHATLIAYMKSVHPVRSFSAWVPITDIGQWYYESVGRGTHYHQHIGLVTTGQADRMDQEEARRRSPLHMLTPTAQRARSKLYLYAGIHDGYTGSVPITHTLEMYNKVVQDFDPSATQSLIPAHLIHQLAVMRLAPDSRLTALADRKVHYQQRFSDKVQVTIFEGGHEMLPAAALLHVPSVTYLTIGDSNGQHPEGWVEQLKTLRFADVFLNSAVSGNTIGFDNQGKTSLNTIKNIRRYLDQHDPTRQRVDKILILLGTNDAKKEFADRSEEVPKHYGQLLDSLALLYPAGGLPEIILISPPPMGEDTQMEEKYHGGAKRVRQFNEAFQQMAKTRNLPYIDIQTPMWVVYPDLSPDGVHFSPTGYRLLGELIHHRLKD